MDGVHKVLHEANRCPDNPVLAPEHPWEGRALESPIVFWDEDLKLFRMYYWALHSDAIYTCYATSEDGIRWEKPVLGLHAGPDGSKDNNIVLRGEAAQARTRYVVRNPYSNDPAKKYVALYIDNVPGLTEFIAYSPDGLHWTTAIKIGDLRNVTGAPPTPNPRFFLIEQRWAPGTEHRYRAIWRTESHDLETWGGGTWAILRQADDDSNLEFYHATSHFVGTHTYHGLHLGYYYRYHTQPEGATLADGTRMAGTIDTSLMVSRDTIHWHLVDRSKPFLPVGSEGAWDAGMVFASPEIVVGDELRFYYGAWRLEHSAGAKNDGGIGLAILRLDGFVSVEPIRQEGSVTTKPFVLAGRRLELNFDARDGAICVEVLDPAGEPIPGYGRDEAATIQDLDGMRLEPRWEGHPDLNALVGRTVRVRFYLENAKLYAFPGSDRAGRAERHGPRQSCEARRVIVRVPSGR
jgi:hypothetical protein